MPNKIDTKLAELRAAGRKGLMTHVVIGYPSLADTVELVVTMESSGVDFVELQIPFSDPLADGPTIQRACEASLERGTRVQDAFAVARELEGKVQIPLLFMAYFNTVFKYGVQRFCADAAAAGVAGLIVPDVPLEAAEHEGFLAACQQYGLHNIVTLAPTSTVKRLEANNTIASGFAYCMSRQGVTGTQSGLAPDIAAYLARVRKHVTVPLAVGFGIGDRERLAMVLPHCDIAVIGSALIDRIATSHNTKPTRVARDFIASLQFRPK